VVVAPIGIPASRIAAAPGALLLSADDVRAAFPRRDPAAFKNRYGHLLVVGGLTGKTGAAFLAATAALRSGAGLVTVATDRAGAAAVQGRFPDVMVEGAFDLAGDWVQSDDASVDALVAGRDALVAGPGLSTRPGADALLDRLLRAPVPVVLDADALNLVAARGGSLPGLGPDRVLTPHPGEAGRLLGIPGATVQADRVSAVRALVDRTGCVVVLKGAGTLVATPDGRLAVNDTGGPALAVAGSGDVLAGMVGALLARGLPPFEAAGAAVHLHGLAGDLAARDRTEHGVLASDLVDTIPAALRSLGVP
jgi:NAD(P)H-hydrate epimerase